LALFVRRLPRPKRSRLTHSLHALPSTPLGFLYTDLSCQALRRCAAQKDARFCLWRGARYAHFRQSGRALCRLAGVPEVVPHSLRGFDATLALEGGATADAVAKALGYSSFAMTEQHYASPSSVSNSRSSRVAQTLGGGGENKFSEMLNSLSEIDLQNLLAELQARGVQRESTVADNAT